MWIGFPWIGRGRGEHRAHAGESADASTRSETMKRAASIWGCEEVQPDIDKHRTESPSGQLESVYTQMPASAGRRCGQLSSGADDYQRLRRPYESGFNNYSDSARGGSRTIHAYYRGEYQYAPSATGTRRRCTRFSCTVDFIATRGVCTPNRSGHDPGDRSRRRTMRG